MGNGSANLCFDVQVVGDAGASDSNSGRVVSVAEVDVVGVATGAAVVGVTVVCRWCAGERSMRAAFESLASVAGGY